MYKYHCMNYFINLLKVMLGEISYFIFKASKNSTIHPFIRALLSPLFLGTHTLELKYKTHEYNYNCMNYFINILKVVLGEISYFIVFIKVSLRKVSKASLLN